MDIQAIKLTLIEWLASLKDESTIRKIEGLRQLEFKKSYEESLKPFTDEQMNRRVQASEDDIKYGRTSSSDDVEKESENW